ncbi:hypothetical protein E0L36_14360 [Streptomyces sp. AJS327]|nr:hypothetical protein [Streptomyces sp. AJS327]
MLFALVPLACLPYLVLKISWLCGGTAGIPEGSVLRDGGGTLWAVNLLTAVMDATVILLALALTHPRGRRLPSTLVAVPLWCASGLLGLILVAFPIQALHGALTGAGGSTGDADGGAEELLDGWVWNTVYTGFSVQGLVLAALSVLYVRERWGALLRIRPGTLPGAPRPTARSRAVLGVAALGALPVAAFHALWAAGSEWGLDAEVAAERTADTRIVEATHLLFVLLAVAGTAWLVRGGGRVPLWRPLLVAWVGSGALACWGAWMLMGALSGGGRTLGDRITGPMQGTYVLQTLVGLLLAALVARALTGCARALERR